MKDGQAGNPATSAPGTRAVAAAATSGNQRVLRVSLCSSGEDAKHELVDQLLARLGASAVSRGTGSHGDVVEGAFSTAKRSFLLTGTRGQGQTTRHLATGSPRADVSVIGVDGRAGVKTQAKHGIYLARQLGLAHVVLLVDQLDLVDDAQAVFTRIEAECNALATELALPGVVCIPISAVKGDNVAARSSTLAWYRGPTLLELLESVSLDETRRQRQPLRLPVESGTAPAGGRDLAGTLVAGRLRKGDSIRVQPSGRISQVTRVVTAEGEVPEAVAGQSVTLTLADAVEGARGDLIVAASDPAEIADQFEATLVWLAETPLLPGRSYAMKIGTRLVMATVTPLKYRVDVDTGKHVAASKLEPDAIGVCNLELDKAIAFDPYAVNPDTGGFVLLDPITGETVGAGMLHFALRRASNVQWQALDVNKTGRAALKGQKPCVLWFTGLSGSGKSTIANLVEKKLHSLKHHTYLLDGDNIRHGLNKNLGFTDADRVENIRRIAEVAKLMVDAGLIVSTAFISPFRAERQMARGLVAEGEFIEIFVATPLGVAEERDPKGLYKKARRGELKNFTGIDSPYEPPERPEMTIDTTAMTAEEASEKIVAYLAERGRLSP